ncbi:MAG: ABC transporter permease [Actinomycetota bacterium]
MTATIRSAGAHSPQVVAALVRRSLLRVRRMPSAFIPSLIMPVFQLIAFSGAFGAAVRMLNIDPMNWYMPLNAIQGASFGALGASFGLLNDMETGFFDRVLMAPLKRSTIVIGGYAAAIARGVVPVSFVVIVSYIGGLHTPGGLLAIPMVIVASVLVSLSACGLALGLTFRMRNLGAATLTQFAIFFCIFLSTSQVPLASMSGWLRACARVNPMTNVLRFARQGFLGDITWAQTWGGLVAMGVMFTASTIFALTGLRRYDL